MKKKFLITLLSIFLTGQYVYCQQDQSILDIPKTVPPSPTASSLGKYGEWPVSTYTGIPQIEIPLYTINTGKLQVPVTLSYHASGIKIEEIPSWVGAGWALNAGGVITRTPMGIEDEKPFGYVHTPARYKGSTMATTFDVTNNLGDLAFFNYAASGAYDTEPDVYYFNFPGGTGKLFLDENNQFKAANVSTLKVVSNPITGFQTAVSYWQLVDGNGLTYVFGSMLPDGNAQEYTTVVSETRGMQNFTGQVKSAWYLKYIISADKLDSITFNYANKSENYNSIPRQYFRWPVNYGRTPAKESQTYGFSSTQVSLDIISNRGYCILKDIQWNQGKLVLTANTARLDNITGGVLLDKLDLNDKKGNLIRSYLLSFDNNVNRPYLTQVSTASSTTGFEMYTFSYYPGLPGRLSNDQDHWGYYNNAGNTNLTPYDPLLSLSIYTPDFLGASKPSANREPNALNTNAGSLKTISYPTGGKTDFEYATNTYTKIGADALNPAGQTFTSNKYGGGLRIKSIKSYDQAGTLSGEKDYNYDFPISTGLLANKPIYGNASFQMYSLCCGTGDCWNIPIDVVNISPRSQVILGITQGSPVGYSTVEESINRGNGGKTIYYYRNDPDIFNDVNFDTHFQQYGRPAYLQSTSNDYKNGQLLTREFYSYTTGFNLIKKVENTYDNNDAPGEPNYYRLPVLKIKSTGDSTLSCTGYFGNVNISYRKFLFAYGVYYLKSVWPQLTTSVETTYDNNGTSSASTTNYSYDNLQHLQITKVSKTNSKLDVIEQRISYPHDMVSLGLDPTAIYQNMVSRNMVISPIRTQVYKNGTTLLRSFTTTYKDWGSNIIKPETIVSGTLNSSPEVRIRYQLYDSKANVLTVSKEQNVKQNYLWGYNNTYPVAEVTGSDYTTINGFVNQSILKNPANDQQLRDELNKIRTNLAGAKALVNTYTYVPLLGISSQTDASGKTLYYTYDGFGRLVLIRDDNNNIIKKYCYNYQGQVENCNIYLQSVTKSGTYTKACGAGFTGSSVTYSVPAGTYYSTASIVDADTKAQADVTANGLNYANDQGVCTAISFVTIQGYNSKGTDYKVKFVNNSEGAIYLFSLPTGTSTAQTLGQVPQGTYTVSFVPNPSPVPSATYKINNGVTTFLFSGGSGPTFNNIPINATTIAFMF